ncbi:L-lysine 2:3-aminomutase [Diplocarpon mali]|nr:L-lysine 2:3-aminomutase [Diplocarpon mali]
MPVILTASGMKAWTRQYSRSEDYKNIDQNTNIPEVAVVPFYHRSFKFERFPYWENIARWKDVPDTVPVVRMQHSKGYKIQVPEQGGRFQSREAFIVDVMDGMAMAPMSIRLTPHILASIDWKNTLSDPLTRQFIPNKITLQSDHPKLTLDSLYETENSPCEGLCTRSYAVGADTETVTKASLKPKRTPWNEMPDYIAATPSIQDVAILGGDLYSQPGMQLRMIGDRLLSVPHVRRFRVASTGLCVSPSRTLDPDDEWTEECKVKYREEYFVTSISLIRLSRIGREGGVHVALRTHFNHPNEFSNQSVLLKGTNDDAETIGTLIRELTDNNIIPLRGRITGFMTPQFDADLPGGGGALLQLIKIAYAILSDLTSSITHDETTVQ